ncbi:hypothetical protein PCLA_04r0190 [Pseudomonas citronellolis]|nr:hypothetical protein PCLA_04r0190 [Pseudomonas citronellolis]
MATGNRPRLTPRRGPGDGAAMALRSIFTPKDGHFLYNGRPFRE